MLLRIIWRDLRTQGFAWILKVIGMASAVAMLLVASILVDKQHSGTLPGSRCADRIVTVGLQRGGLADVANRLSLAQMQALADEIPDVQNAIVTQASGLVQTKRGYEKVVGLELVQAGFFDVICVAPQSADVGSGSEPPDTHGVVVAGNLRREMLPDTPVKRLGGAALPVVATIDGFAGIVPGASYLGNAPQGWSPLEPGEAPSAIGTLVVRLPPGMDVSELVGRLTPVLRTRDQLFEGAVGLVIAPAGMAPAQVQLYRYSAWAVRGFGWILFFLTIVSVACHQYGRIEQTTVLARIMTAVGTPPAQIWKLAAVEPILLVFLALAGGYGIAWLALGLLPATHSWSLGFGWLPQIALVLCVPLVALVVLRGRLLLARATPAAGRGWRILYGALPLLLFVQAALAALATGLAAQTAVQSAWNQPPAPTISLAGLTYLTARQEAYKAPAQGHLAERWQAIWQEHPVAGYQVALATRAAPFLGEPPQEPMWVGGKKFLYRDVGVSPNFFQVLGIKNAPVLDSRSFIINPVLHQYLSDTFGAKALMQVQGADGVRRIWQSTAVVDDGVAGNTHSTFDFNVTYSLDASNQLATPPTAYHLLAGELDSRSPLTMVVRHPPDVTSDKAAEVLLPRLRQLLPSTQWEMVRPAQEMLTPSGATSGLFVGILIAAATLSVGGFGLLALLAMYTRSMRVEILLGSVYGGTANHSIWLIVRRCSWPYLFGVAAGMVPVALFVAMQSSSLARVNTTVAWYGPLVAIAFLLVVLAWAVWSGVKSVRQGNFATQLRHD